MDEVFDQGKDREGPIFYGFSVSVGPNGKPKIQEFGNVKPGLRGPELKEERATRRCHGQQRFFVGLC